MRFAVAVNLRADESRRVEGALPVGGYQPVFDPVELVARFDRRGRDGVQLARRRVDAQLVHDDLRPQLRDQERDPVHRRRDAQDPVVVLREALRLHHALSPARRAPAPVAVLRAPSVEALDNLLRELGHVVHRHVRVVVQQRQIDHARLVQQPARISRRFEPSAYEQMPRIGHGSSVALRDGRRQTAFGPSHPSAATGAEEPAIPVALVERQPDVHVHCIVPARVRVGDGDVAEVYGALFSWERAESEGPGGVGVDFGGVGVCDAGAADGKSGKCVGMAGRFCCGGGEGGEEEEGEDGGEEIGGEGWHCGGGCCVFYAFWYCLQWVVDLKGGWISTYTLIVSRRLDQHPSRATDEQPRPR